MHGESSEQLDQLIAMGFSLEQAQQALDHCQNSVVLAVDGLINHPTSPASPVLDPPPVLHLPHPVVFPGPGPVPVLPRPPNPPPNPPPSNAASNNALDVRVEDNILKIGEHLCITFERTLRVPDDGKIYPLPPSLGQFPVLRVDDYLDRVPDSWRTTGGVFIPLFQREACFIQFHGNHNHPCAVKVAVGKVNAISGRPWSQTLSADLNDYVCVPDQPWLDGINNGNGTIKQFVAMPLGKGYTVEAQVTGKEVFGGFQIMSFNSKSRVPDKWHPRRADQPAFDDMHILSANLGPQQSQQQQSDALSDQMELFSMKESCEEEAPGLLFSMPAASVPAPPPAPAPAPLSSSSARAGGSASGFAAGLPAGTIMKKGKRSLGSIARDRREAQGEQHQVEGAREMGLAAGGTIKQSIYSDPYGINSWDQSKFGRVFVHIVNSQMWTQITGQAPPETPISAKTYSSMGYPWFDIYDEHTQTVPASSALSGVKTVKETDQDKYAWPQQDDSSIRLSGSQVHQLPDKKPDPHHSVRDGSW